MELAITKQPVTVCETVLATQLEQPLECDVLLPENSPDMARVLSCQGRVWVTDQPAAGDRVALEGMAVLSLYYLTEEEIPRRAEYKIPFTREVELKSEAGRPWVQASAQITYLNCRQVSARRVDIRGAATIDLLVKNLAEQPLVTEAQGGGLVVKSARQNATSILGRCSRPFTMQEQLELGYGKPPIGQVLRSEASAPAGECRVVGGKAVVKGDLAIKAVYFTAEQPPQCETMEYTLPISQILDAPAGDEQAQCLVELTVEGLQLQPQPGEDGMNRGFSLQADLTAHITMLRDCQVEAACDCYSTEYAVQASTRPVSLPYLAAQVNERITVKEKVPLGEENLQVMDLWAEPGAVNAAFTAEGGTLTGRLDLSMLAGGPDHGVLYLNRPLDFTHPLHLPDLPCEDPTFRPQVQVASLSYVMAGPAEVEVRCDLVVSGPLWCGQPFSAIEAIAVQADAPIPRDPEVALLVYYARAGESIWQIAKRYAADPARIAEDNALSGDRLTEGRPLMIAMV